MLIAQETMTSLGYVLSLSNVNFWIIFPSTALLFNDTIRPWCLCCCGFHTNIKLFTNFSSSLLNSHTLYDKIILGAPKITIQFLIIASAISSIFLLFTTVLALHLVSWYIRCKVYLLSISFKSTAMTSLKSLDKENVTASFSFGFPYFKHISQILLSLFNSWSHILLDFYNFFNFSTLEWVILFCFFHQVILMITHLWLKVLFLIHYSYQNDLTTVHFY